MSCTVVIIGAGVAGLTLAQKLQSHGINTVIIERESVVGGLARSFTYDNGATYDIGPHRFHTDDAEVQRFIEETLAEDRITIDRNSQLFLFEKYLPWPITLKNVFSLPPAKLVQMGIDLFSSRKAKNESFEDYIIERYGRTLYHAFFKPYTEKFLSYTCSNLHRDWASAGINRATIDKQIKTASLFELAKSVLFAKNPDTTFLYPQSGGIGVFAERLASDIMRMGGKIMLSSQVSEFVTEGQVVRKVITDRDEEITTDHLFWSGSLNSLCDIGGFPNGIPRMLYVSTLIYNYLVSDRVEKDFQWCYFGDAQMEVDRISLPRNFNPGLVPPGKDAICVEVVSSENSDAWENPYRLDCVIETFLLRAGLINSLDSIEEYCVEKILETYPVYTLNYPRKLQSLFEWVSANFHNLTLLGRTGRFWYNNMDHSIAASLAIADQFIHDHRKGSLQPGSAYASEDRNMQGLTR